MDALLYDLKNVCGQLVPILGAVALIFLCILLKKAWKLIDQVTATVQSVDPTIKLANTSIEKLQAPLDTAVKLSGTIDEVHDKTVESVGKASEFMAENMESVKSFVSDKFGRRTAREETFTAPSAPQAAKPAEAGSTEKEEPSNE